MADTKEAQYQECVDIQSRHGTTSLGLMNNATWHLDPKRLMFVMARYKFVAKMFSGKSKVLEVGCADGFSTRIVRQEVAALTAIDFDELFIADARTHDSAKWPIDFQVHDLMTGPAPGGPYDAAYTLDVLEHIPAEQEDLFLENLCRSLAGPGTAIIGMPSQESQAWASPQSKEGHVNCKSGKDLKACLQRHFQEVFVFSMNDEVVHTGFFPMANYLMALCVGSRRTA